MIVAPQSYMSLTERTYLSSGQQEHAMCMSVVALEHCPSSRLGGQELSLLDVTRYLAHRGHKIILLYVTDGDLLQEYSAFCAQLIKVSGYSISPRHRIQDIINFLADLLRMPRSSSMLVYANQYLDSLFAAALSRLRDCPFVCHLRLPPPDVFCGQFRLGISRANRLIAVSEQTRLDYVKRGFNPEAIDVVHNGIDVSRFPLVDYRTLRSKLGLGRDQFVVTYAGRFDPVKGVMTLLDAVERLKRSGTACELFLAGGTDIPPGDGLLRDHPSELRARADSLGISANTHWLGHYSDIATLFGASDVVVLPSLWSEPFGRIIIEAMACGTPVVASRVGGITEILSGEFRRLTFASGNHQELADLLGRLRNWRTEDPTLASRCRLHVMDNFDINRTIDGIERSLLGTLQQFDSGILPPTTLARIR